MSARLSKGVTDRVRSGRHLLSAFEVEGARVAAHFEETTRPHLGQDAPESRPEGFLAAAGATIRSALDHLVETDVAVARAASLESVLRKQFREGKRQLAFLIVALRRMVEADMASLGLEPVNVRDGITVVRRGELVGERFAASNLARLLGRTRFGQAPDLDPWVAEIREEAAQLLTLSEAIHQAERGTDRARRERKRAKEVYERAYLRGSRMFEDLARFAGLDELAAKIRKRQRRPGQSETQTPRM